MKIWTEGKKVWRERESLPFPLPEGVNFRDLLESISRRAKKTCWLVFSEEEEKHLSRIVAALGMSGQFSAGRFHLAFYHFRKSICVQDPGTFFAGFERIYEGFSVKHDQNVPDGKWCLAFKITKPFVNQSIRK